MKKYFLLSLALAVSGICVAYDFTAVSPSGHTLYYTIDGSNVKVAPEIYDPNSLGDNTAYTTPPTGALEIPDTVSHEDVTYIVTTIAEGAFMECRGLTDVTIPATVTTIEMNAFSQCSGIRYLNVPATVTSIANYAFTDVRHVEYHGSATGNWEALSLNGVVEGHFAYPDSSKTWLTVCLDTEADGTVTIPASVKVIAKNAFLYLRSLTTIDVPNTVDSIGRFVFQGCENLESATLPAHISMIDAYLFCDCKSLKSFVVPDSAKKIRANAFLNCTSLEEVTIGYGMKNIYGNAFRNCTGLKKINSLAPVAPELTNGDPFTNVPKDSVVVIVPCGAAEDYRQHADWELFQNIIDDCVTTAIEDVRIDGERAAKIFNNGALYILMPDGKIYSITGQ